jgi:hypothetical protein
VGGVSGPPGHLPFEPIYEPSFAADRATLGLSGRDFDFRFKDIENDRRDYPYKESVEVPEGEGIRMMSTLKASPDLPALYVYYRVLENPNRIVFLGLSPAWSKQDLHPF